MRFTEHARQLLEQLEGCRPTAYADQCKSLKDPGHVCVPQCKGVWTIGYGHTGPEVKPGLRWSPSQADSALASDLQRFILGVSAMLTEPLTDNQFSALVIFAFNVGLMALRGSSAMRLIKLGQLAQVPPALALWDKVHDSSGVPFVSANLAKRRTAEIALWRTP
jgi:lysozyme